MGGGPSKKKVAPACVNEVNVSKTAAGVTAAKQDRRPFKPLKIQAILRNARNNRAQPDCHSDGHDSDLSGEDEDEDDDDDEPDTVVKGRGERERGSVKARPPKKTFTRARTYGLCHFGRADAEEDSGPALRPGGSGRAEEPRGSHGGARDVNNSSKDAFTHLEKHTPVRPGQHNSSPRNFLTRGALLEAAPPAEKQSTVGSCRGSSVAMPVIPYDGSEEELMDTIEREFS